MSLLSVRETFATDSGRHDLVTDFSGDDFSDNGADRFLQAGQRLLDRKASFVKGYSWYKKDVSEGGYKLNFRYCTAIKQVWAMEADTDRYRLTRKDLDWIRAKYGKAYADLTTGSPSYYTPIVANLGPDQVALTTSNYTDEFTYDYEEILFSDTADHFHYNAILWMPPLNKTYTISILGRFWSPILTGDTMETFWTEVHPDILVLSALYCLERTYRNREGMADYMTAILDAISDLDRDMVEEEIQDHDRMEG